MAFAAIRRLIVHKKHIGLLTSNVSDHTVAPGALIHVPDDLILGLTAVELGAAAGPELREIELVATPLVPESGQQLAAEGHEPDLRTSAAYVKHRILELAATDLAGEIVGGKPHPRRCEAFAPVLVGIAITGLRTDIVEASVPANRATVTALHTLGVPEHLEGLQPPHRTAGAIAHIEGGDFLYLQIPLQVAGAAHPLRMGRSLFRRNADTATGMSLIQFEDRTVGNRSLDRERTAEIDFYLAPRQEFMQLGGILAPSSGLDHQIGRTTSGRTDSTGKA